MAVNVGVVLGALHARSVKQTARLAWRKWG
jgi:hypothetical protein